MEPYKVLTDSEKNMIEDYINEFVFDKKSPWNSDHLKVQDLEHVLRFWNTNKQKIFNTIFKDKLILEKEVTLSLEEKTLISLMANLLCSTETKAYKFIQELRDAVWLRIKDDTTRRRIVSFFNEEILVSNKQKADDFCYIRKNGKKKTFSKGSKVMRSIEFFAKEFGIEGFEDFRLAHSQILNQKVLKGTLCLSIHPLDYMTMSDNNENWKSCMNWKSFGAYRQGTVEMMNSEYVIVAYLKSNNKGMKIGENEWNSKKWRSLISVDLLDGILFNIKGYPYQNKELNKTCLDWLVELFSSKEDFNIIEDNNFQNEDYLTPEGESARLSESIYASIYTGGFMYNDMDSYSIPRYFYIHKDFSDKDYTLFLSGPSECMVCGSEFSKSDIYEEFDVYNDDELDEFASMLICPNCFPTVTCTICGKEIKYMTTGGQREYIHDGQIYHENCFYDTHFYDSLTGDYAKKEDMVQVKAMDKSYFYNTYLSDTNPYRNFEGSNYFTIYTTKRKVSELIKRTKAFHKNESSYIFFTEDLIKIKDNFYLGHLRYFLESYDYRKREENDYIQRKLSTILGLDSIGTITAWNLRDKFGIIDLGD